LSEGTAGERVTTKILEKEKIFHWEEGQSTPFRELLSSHHHDHDTTSSIATEVISHP
jgi:hypothetical protein